MNDYKPLASQAKRNNWYAYLITILPVMMMYKIPILNIGVSTFFALLTALYLGLLLLQRGNRIRWRIVGPITLYLLWTVIRSGGSVNGMLLNVAVIIHLMAISTGILNISTVKKATIFITTLGATLIIMQTVFHYLLGIHIPMVALDLCLDSMKQYTQSLTTGFSGMSTLYRPSAFFLEPSHFAQYAILAITFCLLQDRPLYKKALLITFGVLLTTSGMGVVLVALTWCWHGLHVLRNSTASKKVTRTFSMAIIACVVIMVLMQIPLFQNTIARFLVPKEFSQDGYNAIWGRTLFWDSFIKPLSGMDLFIGKSAVSRPEVYFTGLMDMLYCYGIIGTVLFYIAVLRMATQNNSAVTFLALLVGGLMLIANLNGFISLLLFFGVMTSLILSENSQNDRLAMRSAWHPQHQKGGVQY